MWSAGCSTGEEAYSIAILFREVLEEMNIQRDVKIFATDVDAKAIEQAGKGVFTESNIGRCVRGTPCEIFYKEKMTSM